MMKKTLTPANRIDRIFRAFADRTRLRILCLLRDGELCVCDLMEVLGIEQQPRVSRHLAYLRKSGLVQARKARQWSYYSLAPAQGCLHEKLLGCLATCFQDVPEIQADARRRAKVNQSGGCCPDE
jgi:ArsR family transcriptional regulator